VWSRLLGYGRDVADATGEGQGQGAADATLTMRAAFVSDLRSSTWGRRIALLGVCAWLAYEWGPGNETVTPWVLVRVIGGHDGWTTILFAASVGFAFTATQQLASGFTAVAGFSMFERSAQASWRRLSRHAGVAPTQWSQLGWLARAALVFGLGTTAVALVEIMSTGQTGVRRHARVVWTSALLCASLVAALGAIGACLALAGRSVDSLRGGTDWILRVLGNPLVWLAIVVVILIRQALSARRNGTPTACAQP
jgi:hypothetical protein